MLRTTRNAPATTLKNKLFHATKVGGLVAAGVAGLAAGAGKKNVLRAAQVGLAAGGAGLALYKAHQIYKGRRRASMLDSITKKILRPENVCQQLKEKITLQPWTTTEGRIKSRFDYNPDLQCYRFGENNTHCDLVAVIFSPMDDVTWACRIWDSNKMNMLKPLCVDVYLFTPYCTAAGAAIEDMNEKYNSFADNICASIKRSLTDNEHRKKVLLFGKGTGGYIASVVGMKLIDTDAVGRIALILHNTFGSLGELMRNYGVMSSQNEDGDMFNTRENIKKMFQSELAKEMPLSFLHSYNEHADDELNYKGSKNRSLSNLGLELESPHHRVYDHMIRIKDTNSLNGIPVRLVEGAIRFLTDPANNP